MDSAYDLSIPLTVADFSTAHFTIRIFYNLIVDSTNCSGFHKYCCGFRKVAYFWCDFERYSVYSYLFVESNTAKKLLQNVDQIKIQCCRICSKFTKFTIWPRNVVKFNFHPLRIYNNKFCKNSNFYHLELYNQKHLTFT